MNTKKLVLASAVTAALAGAGSVQATIQGVPGEALLIPFVAADFGEPSNGRINDSDEIHSAVIITTPAVVGADTVLGEYTMPNTLDANELYEAPAEMEVHWYAFDERSKEIADDTFPMTPNDVYLWSPRAERLREYIGYLVFADDVARKGDKAATFGMAGHAFLLLEESCEPLGEPDTGLCATTADQNMVLPVVPMADGIDPLCGADPCSEEDGNAHLGINFKNNVVSFRTGNPTSDGVGHVSPLIAGVRMQSPFGAELQRYVYVQGLYSPFEGNWTHVFWFSENDDSRFADPVAFDDEEEDFSCEIIPLPNELNAFVYADEYEIVYDLIHGFKLATDNDGRTTFEDACLQTGGNIADAGENCLSVCGNGVLFGGVNSDGDYEFTQTAPGIGIMEYTLDAGPHRTSTAMFFQFMSDVTWDGDDLPCTEVDQSGCSPDVPAVGSDFDIYAGGFLPMTELGRVK
mgnify:FL=1